jgi:branched-chain amino acid transport system ATP-binding protein
MLRIEDLAASYGRSRVLFGVSLAVNDGEVVTLLGRNGMGKTTTIRAIMGLLPSQGGTMTFDQQPLRGQAPERIARLGIGLVPEGRQVFPTLSVHENLIATAANRLHQKSPWTLQRVFRLFPRLDERAAQRASTLSGGEQQMLAIGRALMTNPKLLILDEATEGLAPLIRAEIWTCIETLKREGLSILLIDRNLNVLKRIADRHYILEKGVTVWSGSRIELERDAETVHRHVGL